MQKLLLAFAIAGLATAPAFSADTRCRDAKGHFAKCPSVPAASADIAKGKDGKCRWTKTTKDHKAGTFAKCP
jgi:hypothetical protein